VSCSVYLQLATPPCIGVRKSDKTTSELQVQASEQQVHACPLPRPLRPRQCQRDTAKHQQQPLLLCVAYVCVCVSEGVCV
jgi:hypothetical protein